MTQEQYKWLKDNGYDPAVYDVDNEGNIFKSPVQAATEPQREVMSKPRAFGTSFAGSLLPSAAGLGGAKLGMMAGAPFGPVGIGLGAIGGGLGAGYLAGKGQEAVLEKVAPEAIAEMQRAQTDQPVMSYLGGFAPNALAFRPSLQGMGGLLRPTLQGEETLRAALSNPNFLAPAANIAANVGASTAGQLINVAEGGEFSAPRFAADVGLGVLFNRPTALGRAMGFHDMPQGRPVEKSDLAAATERTAQERADIERITSEMDTAAQNLEQLRQTPAAAERVGEEIRTPEQYFTPEGKSLTEERRVRDYSKWWKSETEPTVDLLKGAAEEVKSQVPKEKLAELANDPEVGEVLRDPSKMEMFVAKNADQTLEDVYQMLERRRAREFATPEEVANQKALQDLRAERGLPSETPLSDVEAAYAARGRTAEQAARELYAPELEGPSAPKPPSVSKAAEGYQMVRPPEAVKNATDAAREVYTRFQRAPEEGPRKITQQDIDFAAEVAARRGLKIELDRAFTEGGQEVRGMYFTDPKTGDRIIRVNPLMATADTAIHEIGHDIFQGVTNKGMRRSLMETAMDSPAYKAELASREAEVKAGLMTPEKAQEIALEEGLIQAFGEQMPNINRGELRAWFAAFKASMKQLVTGKMTPQDALAWMHYASTEAVPWKGAVAVKGGVGEEKPVDTLSQEVRYQRGIASEAKELASRAFKFAEIDRLESRGGIYALVARGMRAFTSTKSFMEGQAQAKEHAMSKLTPERQVMLGRHIGQEFDQRRFITPPSEIADAYREYRQEWQKFWPTETNKAGHTVRTAGGNRERLTDPYYGPFHMWNDNVRDIMTTQQGSPEYVKLKDDYVKQHERVYQENGKSLPEAQALAEQDFQTEVRELSAPYDPTGATTFAGARKAQGIPLPDSWREYNILKLVQNYDKRSAIDYAMQQHMEKSPEIMAALGAEKFFNDEPIPAAVKAVTPNISSDPSVKSILREMSGKPARRPDEITAGASRSISALTIGTASKATEIPTTMIAGLRYLQGSDYLPGTMKFLEKLGDWAALQERSFASGLNKREGAQNMRQIAGVGENASGYLNKFAEGVSSITGLNKLEQAARTLAQGWGEVLVDINKRKAFTGDKDAIRTMDTLSPDWRTRSDANLAMEFGKLMQGSYDMTQLPAWMLESGAAPYLTWMKWSAGQYNNFMKFAIEPAMQGNVKPLIGHLLVGVFGGLAVDQIREWINNREGRDVNWNELQAWMEQNQGQLGAEGMKQLATKLLNVTQAVGTFGIAGDVAKMMVTAGVGGTAQGVATAPVANAVFDTSKKIAAALKALDDGEDFGLVMRYALDDVAKSHVQVYRVVNNWIDTQENLRYDDRRRRKLFDELMGLPTPGGTYSVNYGNVSERKFERGEISPQTGEEAMSLVSRARQESATPEEYASRIRKYKTAQNEIMPSMERQPMKAARYLSWLEGAEEGAGAETMRRYVIREQENKYRKSLIEGLSGLR